MPEKKLKQLTIRLPEKLHFKLRMRALKEGRSANTLIEQLVREYLSTKKKGG